MADIVVAEGSPVDGVQRYVRYVDNGDGTWSLKVSSTGGGGGGGESYSKTFGAGVGLQGQGSSGAGAVYPGVSYATGGSGGGNAASGVAGAYGGGGTQATKGADGAVRIIWSGNERQFPSTRTANE